MSADGFNAPPRVAEATGSNQKKTAPVVGATYPVPYGKGMLPILLITQLLC